MDEDLTKDRRDALEEQKKFVHHEIFNTLKAKDRLEKELKMYEEWLRDVAEELKTL